MAHDYRYFPDPDLMPVQVDEAWKSQLRAECPELPFEKQRRLLKEYGVPYTITSVLVPDRPLSDFFEEAARLSGKPQAAGNWIANDLLRELGAARLPLAQSKVRPAHVAGLVRLVDDGTILSNAAKEVFVDMFQTGDLPEAVVARRGLRAETNLDELERWCVEAIAANPKSAADFKSGKDSAINAFKGPVMRAAKGKADPKRVDETLRRLLSS
jgi:aspartyl-tRNA(Asn)/glutamyl-tRNA(Gln) amidotransferase subunit B